jgi:hypothetical protein
MHIPHLKKFFAMPIMVATLVLGPGGVALADNPHNPPPALPPDELVLTGACVSLSLVMAAAEQAMNLYAPGAAPAGVVVNDDWVPAALGSGTVQFAATSGCAGTQLPADQIVVTGACPSVGQVTAAAQQALGLYAPGDAPAGVIVNGTWVPAGVAETAAGNTVSNGCAVS